MLDRDERARFAGKAMRERLIRATKRWRDVILTDFQKKMLVVTTPILLVIMSYYVALPYQRCVRLMKGTLDHELSDGELNTLKGECTLRTPW